MYNIRRAKPTDALPLAIVTVYTWKTAYSGIIPDSFIDGRIAGIREVSSTIRSRIEDKNTYWVAEADGCVVGFCCSGPSRDPIYADAGEIYALYVLSGYQGLGIGAALFAAARDELSAKGYNEFIVNCLVGNSAAEFYRKQGGEFCHVRTDRYADTDVDENVFAFRIQ